MPAKRPRDVNELAKRLVEEATGEAEPQRDAPMKDPDAVKRGRARRDSLTPERRREIARKAAETRWRA